MLRNTATFFVEDITTYKQQMLNWGDQFSICCFMDSNNYPDTYSNYDCLLAAGANIIFAPQRNILPQLKAFRQQYPDWLFGHVCYELKNEIEGLTSEHPDHIQFPLIFFFQPETVITVSGNDVIIECLKSQPADIHQQIQEEQLTLPYNHPHNVTLQSRISKEQYITTLEKLKQHILRGDCYEINFCQEFFAEHSAIHPLQAYQQLANVSPTPFAAYYKLNNKYALCASPERYIKKEKDLLISQPVKGTIKRDKTSEQADKALKAALLNSVKNRSENVMIADLVRNDLSRICTEGSVQVKELFGIYTYPQVHQMITTIQGKVPVDIAIADVLQATFPMGSMTGAPKRKVMQLIEQYESSSRGLYSGSIGYITPENDFDFNVVIRSILYDQTNQYISCWAGSAITFYSDAMEEYEECLLKAKAMQQALDIGLL